MRSKGWVYTVLALLIAMGMIILIKADIDKTQLKFAQFKSNITFETLKAGVSYKTIKKYFLSLSINKPTISKHIEQHEKHQAQTEWSFAEYLNNFINQKSILEGQAKLQQYQVLLHQIDFHYTVQPAILIALWRIESDYGTDTGHYPLIRSLTILAFHHHRSSFFKKQLIDALWILDKKPVIPAMLVSAFDGGMGQPQFMPSIYRAYAVDFQHTGFANIWTDVPDVLASVANFLKQNGWRRDQLWGIPVKLPPHFNKQYADPQQPRPLAFWKKFGVTRLDGSPLKATQIIPDQGAMMMPSGAPHKAYLVFHNFLVLMRWNHTMYEALAVGILADHLTTPLSPIILDKTSASSPNH